jgi:hypothetical protein
MWWEGMDFIQMAQARDELWALLNMVMKLCIPKNEVNFLTKWGIISF